MNYNIAANLLYYSNNFKINILLYVGSTQAKNNDEKHS